MLPVLPRYLTTVLKSAGNFARVLSETGFSDAQAIADLNEIASRKGLGAAYVRTRASQGYLAFAEGTIRAIHGSQTFNDHARDPKVIASPHTVPRLRRLLPGRPDKAAWRDQVLGAFAGAVQAGKDPVQMVHDYCYGTAFDELDLNRTRSEFTEDFCNAHPAAALILLDDYRKLERFPEVLRMLLLFGAKYFTENRYFERAYELSSHHRETLGLRGSDVSDVLDRLWYAAFRIGRRAEALEALDRWAALRPTLKRPFVYRALVTSMEDAKAAQDMLEDIGALLGRATVGGNVLYVEQALRAGDLRNAEQAIRNAIFEADSSGGSDVPQDYLIALHNVMIARGHPSFALDAVFAGQDLNLRWTERFGLDTVEDVSPTIRDTQGRVAIVMTAFRAEAYLARAMAGVLSQTHADLELIVVDDCSDDGTADICRAIADGDTRVTYMRTPRNMGTYAAKNMGIRDALTRSPDFVTLCDSDDFWLRNHLAAHLQAMAEDPDAVCSTSQWIRVRDDGTVEAGLRGRYVESCPHSTFFRADVFDRAGLFDAVRFGADREFLNRVSLHFGRDKVIGVPKLLTLGRRHDASLTTSGAGAISEFNESPVRLDYWRNWNEWHIARIRADGAPRTEGDPDAAARPFKAPPEMHV